MKKKMERRKEDGLSSHVGQGNPPKIPGHHLALMSLDEFLLVMSRGGLGLDPPDVHAPIG